MWFELSMREPWSYSLAPNNSLCTSNTTATPMLSFVITLFNIASEPSELAIATWLNSTVCFCTSVNLIKQRELHVNMSDVQLHEKMWFQYALQYTMSKERAYRHELRHVSFVCWFYKSENSSKKYSPSQDRARRLASKTLSREMRYLGFRKSLLVSA